jgi:hypothetical protein
MRAVAGGHGHRTAAGAKDPHSHGKAAVAHGAAFIFRPVGDPLKSARSPHRDRAPRQAPTAPRRRAEPGGFSPQYTAGTNSSFGTGLRV